MFKKISILFFYLFLCMSLDIHKEITNLVYADISKGESYYDPEKRFSIISAEDLSLKVKRLSNGVTLEGMQGLFSYTVVVFLQNSESTITIDDTVQAIIGQFKNNDLSIEVLSKEPEKSSKYETTRLDFYVRGDKKFPDRIYLGKIIKADKFIYWLYYSHADIDLNKISYKDFLKWKNDTAERFFNNVKINSFIGDGGFFKEYINNER